MEGTQGKRIPKSTKIHFWKTWRGYPDRTGCVGSRFDFSALDCRLLASHPPACDFAQATYPRWALPLED